jgi:hypothetical protein
MNKEPLLLTKELYDELGDGKFCNLILQQLKDGDPLTTRIWENVEKVHPDWMRYLNYIGIWYLQEKAKLEGR